MRTILGVAVGAAVTPAFFYSIPSLTTTLLINHLVAAMVMEAAGKDALNVKYIPYDAGGKAMACVLV